ncbi:class A beta-lactamase-related serine hydrolase [Subsaxibacter sp. CAU 1640]|uniref:class A beta-lactamase-related serine hydrolase n=1 Tax=Subsaxibacter sp. CAU 1640 TaxID=2933271 RepID=UPI002006CF00|nr:class A beta-lactamase-related serine hydrolase [Subsaxibacter sp. CAU 1640]MCK7590574.1 class A beta-lactamase-related serine hydrolase [Subsaxibacter sp. CAU 1640]
MLKISSIIILCLTCSIVAKAQIDKQSSLYKELKTQDSIFFERGFNRCDLGYLEAHISEDLKFYHDQGGFQDKKTFFENTRKYICSGGAQKPIREVDASSLEVFPLFNDGKLYAAIQSGVHHFYLREEGKPDVKTSTARFTHIWIKKNDDWQLSEVLSYDHHDPTSDVHPIEKLLKDNHVPALGLGVINNGKLTRVQVYGTLDTKQTAPYNAIFKVASLTKPVFALTVLKLIDNGMLDMDEPLHNHWIDPDIKNDKRYEKLTPKIVLTHQTGFPNWRYMTDSNKLAFEFEPGTKYQYSGEGFEYLRKAIENKLGKSIEDLAKTYLFDPLQMNDTRFWWDEKMDASRYAQNFDENGAPLPTEKYYDANAAANLLTTVEDYGTFLEYLINGAGLSETLYQELIKHQVKLREQDYFGLGWEILTGFSDAEEALLHTGKDPGVSTLAIWFPKSKNGYLIFLNGDHVNAIYEELLTKQLYLGKELWEKR